MSAVPIPARTLVSIEDYLKAEEVSAEKHEYYAGDVLAMAGASVLHNRIVRNTLSSIDNHLKGRTCEVFPSDLKLHVKSKSSFVYPDLSVVCGELEYFNERQDIISNPTVVIEVMSPSTELYDRGKKFMLYRQMESLQEYLLVSSTEMLVEKFTKTQNRVWSLQVFNLPEEQCLIQSINHSVQLSEFYRNVTFESESN